MKLEHAVLFLTGYITLVLVIALLILQRVNIILGM
jgi:hypothetical protein